MDESHLGTHFRSRAWPRREKASWKPMSFPPSRLLSAPGTPVTARGRHSRPQRPGCLRGFEGPGCGQRGYHSDPRVLLKINSSKYIAVYLCGQESKCSLSEFNVQKQITLFTRPGDFQSVCCEHLRSTQCRTTQSGALPLSLDRQVKMQRPPQHEPNGMSESNIQLVFGQISRKCSFFWCTAEV